MTVVGFFFTKMHAEKYEGSKGKINISNNVTVTDVKETELSFGPKDQKGVRFNFLFTSKYEPQVGEITLEGNVLYMAEKEEIKKIAAAWKKDKKVDKNIMKTILNTILIKCNIQALIISKDISLPPPIPLPKVDTKQ